MAVGFTEVPLLQAEKALNNGLFSIVAKCKEKVIGMGRLVGDGIMYWYIQDVAVLPEYQSRGIGSAIVNRLLDYAEKNTFAEMDSTIGLMAAKNKESFYEELKFTRLPNDLIGSGMIKKFIGIKSIH